MTTSTPIARRAARSLLLASFLALPLAAACGGPRDPALARAKAARGDGDIVIGAAWPWEAHKDVLYWQGMELAIDQVNQAGGVLGRHLKVVRQDDHETIDQGRLVAQTLVQDPAMVAVIGHLESYVTVAAAPVYDLNGVVLLAPTSTSPELTTKGYRRVFRTIFTDHEVGKQMAEYGVAKGMKRFVIYYARNEYGRELANAFEEEALARGARVIDRQSYDPGSEANPRSAGQTAAAWGSLEYDGVFIAGQDAQAALLAVELRRRGVTVPILGSDALATPTFTRDGGQSVEGTVIASAFHPRAPEPAVQAFTAAFRQRFGSEPDVGAALGYDAVKVLAEAIRQAGSAAPDDVAAALRGIRNFPGVTGRMTFDAQGNLVGMPIHKVVVRGGRFEYLDDSSLALR